MPIQELAEGSIGVSTTRVTMPPNAGWKKPSAAPKQAARMMMAVRFTCPVTSTAKKIRTTTARARSDEIISSRRE